VIKMTMAEVREIKERISLETINLKGKELREYYSSKSKKIQDKIDELRNAESVAS